MKFSAWMGLEENMVEKALVSSIRNGDKKAFSYIFKAYYSDLVLFVMKYTHEKESAEEIVQEVFYRIWENHSTLKIYNRLTPALLILR